MNTEWQATHHITNRENDDGKKTGNHELFKFYVMKEGVIVPEEMKVTMENENDEILHAIEAPEMIRIREMGINFT